VSIEERWNQTRTMILHIAENAENNQRAIQEELATTQSTVLQVENALQESEALIKRNTSIVEQVAEKLNGYGPFSGFPIRYL
jgi:predicted DNA-binding protein YlxM (UPF0122 family)